MWVVLKTLGPFVGRGGACLQAAVLSKGPEKGLGLGFRV